MISPQLLICVLINTIFFFVLLIQNLFKSEKSKYEYIKNAELAILAIAFTQYALTFIIENYNLFNKDEDREVNLLAQQLRYFDWLITTPLLLYTYWKLAEIEGYIGDFFLLFAMDLIMIISGIIAELFVKDVTTKFWIFAIGTIAYGVIIWKIVEIMNFFKDKGESKKHNLGWYFIIGWLCYPLAFFLGDEAKFIVYSFGDFVNKGLYSISLNEIIVNE
jgi:bacteriorhodopsin